MFRIDAHIQEECVQKKMRVLSYIVAEKISFPPKYKEHTYGHTDGHK